MHPGAVESMQKLVTRFPEKHARVLDVGSYDVNGTYRPMIEGLGFRYTGMDITPGPNVDIVSDDPYSFPFPDDEYDVVISGSTMEHVEAIWLWVPELARVVRPGGLIAILTHWTFPEHRYPIDCWRILPDGMRFLFDQTKVLSDYSIEIVMPTDIAASAFKTEHTPSRR